MTKGALPVLERLTRDLAGARSLEAALAAVADTALALTGADHASVRLIDQDQLRSGARAGVGTDRPAPAFVAGQGVLGWVARTGRIARIPDVRTDTRFEDRRDRGFDVRSVMSIPVVIEGRVRAVISVSAAKGHAFSEEDEALGRLLANAAAQSLRLAEVERMSITDPQTHAYNWRYFRPRLEEEMRRAARTGAPLSLLLMDLDHFKHVNDQHGHAVGDAVLERFADLVRECVRSIDVFVRRGGEEFVLIMPSTGGSRALQAAERIRERLGREPMRVDEQLVLVQTVSIGVATWDGSETADDLEARADAAMYSAKREGRNRVIIAEHPIPLRRRYRTPRTAS